MFMNIDSNYKDLFCCFRLVFTTVFQIFWVPEITIHQNFLVGKQPERGISSVWRDTQRHRTRFLTCKCKFMSIVLMAARSSPAPQPPPAGRAGASYRVRGVGTEQHPQAPAAQSRGSPCPSLRSQLDAEKSQSCSCCSVYLAQAVSLSVPQVPSAKTGTTKWLQLLKEFWEVLVKRLGLGVRANRILHCKLPSAFGTWKQLALNSRELKRYTTLTSKDLWMNFTMVGCTQWMS